jgi:hypothetical protein
VHSKARKAVIKAPFIFDRELESEGILRPDTLEAFMLGWKGWKYYISHPQSRCPECQIFTDYGLRHCECGGECGS